MICNVPSVTVFSLLYQLNKWWAAMSLSVLLDGGDEKEEGPDLVNKLDVLRNCAIRCSSTRDEIVGYIEEEVTSLRKNKKSVAKHLAKEMVKRQWIVENNFVLSSANYILEKHGDDWVKKVFLKNKKKLVQHLWGYRKAKDNAARKGRIEMAKEDFLKILEQYVDECCSFWMYLCGVKEENKISHADFASALVKAVEHGGGQTGELLRYVIKLLKATR